MIPCSNGCNDKNKQDKLERQAQARARHQQAQVQTRAQQPITQTPPAIVNVRNYMGELSRLKNERNGT